MEENIKKIENSNLTKEQKEALVGVLTNKDKRQENSNINEIKPESTKKEFKQNNQEEIKDLNTANTNATDKETETLNLDELSEKMTTDEMNTILNMVASGTREDDILNNIANRLGVEIKQLGKITQYKEERLNQLENAQEEQNEPQTTEEQLNNQEEIKQNENGDQQEKKENLELTDQNQETSAEKTNLNHSQIDTTPEPRKKATKILSCIGKNLEQIVNSKKTKALLVIAGIVTALTLNPALLSYAGYALMGGIGLKAYNDFNEGRSR